MSLHDDDRDEMRDPRIFDDRTAEALLAGRLPAERGDLAPLAELVADVRALAEGPTPRPSAALAALMEQGAVPGLSGPAQTPKAAVLPKWRRTPAMLTTLFSWIAGLSAAGKAAAALTAAGALAAGGVAVGLPDAVTDAFERRDAAVEVEAVEVEDLESTDVEASDEDEDEADNARPEENPATDASAEGRARAASEAHDSARIPATVGPGTGEAQRAEAPGGPETGEAARAAAPAGPETGDEARQQAPAGPETGEEARSTAPAGPATGDEAREEAPASRETGDDARATTPAPASPATGDEDEGQRPETVPPTGAPEGTPGGSRP
jgi:hypothetical protein